MTTANDPEIQSVLDENAGKFEQRTFTAPDTAAALEYSLYIPNGYAADGDAKASGGQDEVMALFDADGVPYSYGEWNAQNAEEERSASVNALTEQGLNANMVRFETGSVFKEDESGMEHMASFNYSYKLSAVRDWMFAQSNGHSESQ